jgi:hypothetical protein
MRRRFRPTLDAMESRSLLTALPIAAINPPAPQNLAEIGVGTPYGPFYLDATSSKPVNIYVFSQAGTTTFRPLVDIKPGTIEVFGVDLPGATVRRAPVDLNHDGIPDAIITVPHASMLHLPVGETIVPLVATDRFKADGQAVEIRAAASVNVYASRAVQPYQTYVGFTLGPNSGSLLNYTVSVSPNGEVSPPQRITPGVYRYYQTAVGTGAHYINMIIPQGNTIVFGDSMTSRSPATRPIYQIVYVGPTNIYKAVRIQ